MRKHINAGVNIDISYQLYQKSTSHGWKWLKTRSTVDTRRVSTWSENKLTSWSFHFQPRLIPTWWTVIWRTRFTFTPTIKYFLFHKRSLETCRILSPVAYTKCGALKCVPCGCFIFSHFHNLCEWKHYLFIFYLVQAFHKSLFTSRRSQIMYSEKEKSTFSSLHSFKINAAHRNE